MSSPAADEQLTIRPLAREDLAAVIAIDAAIEGRSRRTYVERRLAAALREPSLHAQFAARDGDGLAGYILARVLAGEFGRSKASLRLELVGVRPESQRGGAGKRLFEMLLLWAARHQIDALHTSAHWRNAQMLGWLHAMGFRLAPEIVLHRSATAAQPADEPAVTLSDADASARERDFGAPEANDHERMARGVVEIRPMTPADLHEIVQIDRAVTGRDRSSHIEAMLAESTEASRTRISLVGRLDGAIVGFVMARADVGDFGRTEPVAVLDTVGVRPDYARRGIGRRLVMRLLENVSQLQVERVETLVRVADLELLGFFQRMGFTPSQRLAFERPVAA
ncbi:MAG TPA: GNAT family N-acetyltransferase [Ramlibacter sp.]|uniref:GNAT family N-acetyltransferase n=1 Tax=Ramlibacter sp. TaxID=1917967 RepID=UPI002D7F3ECC|nr:GNAT family N-acetyltransferase [Ramlibacter sp.]HET8748507.1 GNAT family N-acetyltransferase [Ramlibacter sp.]